MTGGPPTPALSLAVVLAAALAALGLAASGCGPRGPLAPPEAYDEYCARCHGDEGRGDPKMVRLKPELDLVASEMVRAGDLDLVRERIAEGRGTMPAFRSKLTPGELEALTRYTVERFGAGPGPEMKGE